VSTERPVAPALPFVAAQRLTDHHCHGVLQDGGDLEALLTEGDGGASAGGTAFDSLAGLAFRRWCPPLLDLPEHAPLPEYEARRAALGGAEVNRRFLAASRLGALLVDTGYTPGALLSPAETAAFAGARAFEVVRLEQVAETLAAQALTAGEVIVCAGAIGTPVLLLLSGIGPAAHLRSAGIDVVADLPGVGENLQDHPIIMASYGAPTPLPVSGYNNGEACAALRSVIGSPERSNPISTCYPHER